MTKERWINDHTQTIVKTEREAMMHRMSWESCGVGYPGAFYRVVEYCEFEKLREALHQALEVLRGGQLVSIGSIDSHRSIKVTVELIKNIENKAAL